MDINFTEKLILNVMLNFKIKQKTTKNIKIERDNIFGEVNKIRQSSKGV